MLKRISVFASLVVLLTAILTVPAFPADPGFIAETGKEIPVVFTFKNVRMTDGTIAATANCVTVSSPAPVKSSNNTAHWGAKTTCDRIANLKLTAWVVQYINGYEYPASDEITEYATDSYNSVDQVTQCIGFAPTQWQVKFVPKVDGLPGVPPTGQSSIRTLTCE
jgi:hypothetical protein